MELDSALTEYLGLGQVAQDVRNSLAFRLVAPQAHLSEGDQQAFNHALSHLGQVREGFVISLRASDTSTPTEMRKLVQAILFDWEHAARWFGIDAAVDDKLEMPHPQLIAYAHSYVTMGFIRLLPPDAVTYPQRRRSYADISAPRTPGEMLELIEDMEQVVSDAEIKPIERIERNRLRRTYSFFETSAWLVAYHAARFARKRPEV